MVTPRRRNIADCKQKSRSYVKSAVEVLNPGQMPILTCDQPLYTLWSWPSTYCCVAKFGGLHIAQNAWRSLRR